MSTEKKENKLKKSADKRMISGVCGGLSEFSGTDVTVIRLGFVICSLLTGFIPGFALYILIACIMPKE